MCVLINLTSVTFNTYGEIINAATLFLFAGICGIAPFAIFLGMWVKFDQLRAKVIRQKFGALYENLNLGQGRQIIAIPTIFVARRLILAISVVFCGNFIIQVHALLFGVIA